MEPVGLLYTGRKGVQIIHRCRRCGLIRRTRIVTRGICPDDPEEVRRLSCLPVNY